MRSGSITVTLSDRTPDLYQDRTYSDPCLVQNQGSGDANVDYRSPMRSDARGSSRGSPAALPHPPSSSCICGVRLVTLWLVGSGLGINLGFVACGSGFGDWFRICVEVRLPLYLLLLLLPVPAGFALLCVCV